ncbi:DJ-1/PfpI family protein [Thalassobacillus hwangdonensis]|uniref:DJ-1/PfpI family protein n=1 Tax=Thalassobacillus hwangdonensis TaxID=546108 RepID=A0ABW3L5E9_9BACI
MYTGIILYQRFSEYELSVLLSVLSQGNKPVRYIGLDSTTVQGEAGLTCVTQSKVSDLPIDELDSVVLPGVEDFQHLVGHQGLIDFLKHVQKENMPIGAISSAPYFLAMSGLLDGYRYTTGLTEEQRMFLGTFQEDNYIDAPTVQDGNIVTAKGAAFIDFAITYGKLLQLEFNESWYR